MHLGEIQKFRNLNFSPFPKINRVLCFSKLKSNKPKYQSGAKFPWTLCGKAWKPLSTVWQALGMVLPRDSTLWHCHLCDTTTLCTLPQTARLPHTNDKALLGEQILRSDHAQIREDLQPMSAWTWAEAKNHVFDRLPDRPSVDWPRQRAPRAWSPCPACLCLSLAYKCLQRP
jgi:hypothetical protein